MATYSGADCTGTPVSFEQLIEDATLAASPNTCANDLGELTSRKYYCYAPSNQGFTLYTYTSLNCASPKGPMARSTKTTGRCFNGVAPTETKLKNAVSGSFSYAIFCSASDVASTTLLPAQSTDSPTSTANPTGRPWYPCPPGGCSPGVPHISFYTDAQCQGTGQKTLRLFENVPSATTNCFDVFANQTEMNIPAALNMNVVCTNAEMHVQYYANGCDLSKDPVYAQHYPRYDACLHADMQSVYYEWFCG